MNAMIAEINTEMLLHFTTLGIEDTPSNRREFLLGMQLAWNEDTSTSPEKTEWQNALAAEIHRLNDILDPQ